MAVREAASSGRPSEPRGTRQKMLEVFTPEGRKGMTTLSKHPKSLT